MTADQRPELTIRVACPTCGGSRYIKDATVAATGWIAKTVISVPCQKCTDGTIRQAVSCAGCHHFQPEYNPGIGWCFVVGKSVKPDWGCLAWATREGER